MNQLNTFQKYFVEEFYDDYREGLISRRAFVRRVAYIRGGMAAAVSTMGILGCTPAELPAPTEPIPSPDPTATLSQQPTQAAAPSAQAGELQPVPGAQSPLSVPEGDPAVLTSQVSFTSQGDQVMAYLARPAADGVYPAILVCHENRGLNAHILDVARRFAREGYVALAIDLLSREGGTAAQDPDQVPALLSGAPAERHVADFAAGLAYLQNLDYVEADRIGMTGYCFGGGITWRCATSLPELKAAVPFYGPAPDLEQVPNIKAAVFGVYAEQDSRINASKDALEQALIDAGITHQMKVYPGVNHAFHNDTGQRYDETQATQAWLDTLAWFKQQM
ncbi:MAG: dienelactone hydrolase family protein [Anaerolineales bacterium]|nr:MAG: dienelactone hydrolase family protein [Anaerolineales bacterium]